MLTFRVVFLEDGFPLFTYEGQARTRWDVVNHYVRVLWGKDAVFERDEDTTGIYGRVCRRHRHLYDYWDEPLTGRVQILVSEVDG